MSDVTNPQTPKPRSPDSVGIHNTIGFYLEQIWNSLHKSDLERYCILDIDNIRTGVDLILRHLDFEDDRTLVETKCHNAFVRVRNTKLGFPNS